MKEFLQDIYYNQMNIRMNHQINKIKYRIEVNEKIMKEKNIFSYVQIIYLSLIHVKK